ncbi:kinesin-like protein KIF26A isoform X2 [Vanacampus margaritifer]
MNASVDGQLAPDEVGHPSLEGCPTGESPATPRKRLLSADDPRCSSRPAPEGAGSVSLPETEEKGGFCHTCQKKVSELRKLALTLADKNSFKDTGYAAFLFEQLYTSGRKEGAVTCCQVCFTPLHQLKQEALQTLNAPVLAFGPDMPALPASSFLPQPSRFAASSSSIHANQLSKGQDASILPLEEQPRGPCWSQNSSIPSGPKTSVQVTVAGGQFTGPLSSVTIQAQQYLEGVWSISRVNNFLTQPKPAQSLMGDAGRDVMTSAAPLTTITTSSTGGTKSSTLTPCRLRGPMQTGLPTPITGASSSITPSSSAAASFFIRAAQKLNLSSKRKKQQPSLLHPQEPSIYPTNFSGILQVSPPPAPPCLLRAVSKVKENPGMGKVKVMMRICPSLEATDSSEFQSFLKVDSRKKQVTLYDPASSPPHSSSGHRRSATVAVPKIFAFDAVFTQDASQAEVCSGTVAEVIQSVANGADGCIFCFGQVKLGKTYTMIGQDSSTQTFGVVPCAISWLFKLINERKEKTGTRFSVRVSAVEIFGQEEELKDLLSEASTGSQQEGQSPGIHLREDPICGTQLQNQSELHAPTAEKAAFFLDAAISARSTSRPSADEEERRNSHMLFTLHIYQYRMEKSGKGGMTGGRSRLHLIDLGSCEKVLSKSRDGGGGACLSLNALGNVIMALANGAKHVPYKDSKLTMLLRESLGNINCRTTMIAHISDSPVNYADSLTTIQLASRIHRMRKKKSKYASSSSGGESSCEEGRVRRPPHLRPFHPRTVALDPDLPCLLSDPDYSSSSEQSCDTVIYVGPGGAAISDRELSDNEGPPAFVPIIPSLNKKRTAKEGPLDRDQFFKCNTFAELQERLECIDGSEEPTAFVGEGKRNQASPKMDKSKESGSSVSPKTVASMTCNQDGTSPKQSPKSIAIQPFFSPGAKSKVDISEKQGIPAERKPPECVPNVCRTSADGERNVVSENSVDAEKLPIATTVNPEPVVREKIYFNKKASRKENSEKVERSNTRMPPVGMSHQAVKRRDHCAAPILRAPMEVCQVSSTLQERYFDRDILRATVTLQQPVELNGEDELVFTVVEELSIGGIVDKGRPSSIISFNSDCSLQALASGSRPVSIISSINDEFDAYTSSAGGAELNVEMVTPLQEGATECVHSRGSSVSSWLSEVSVCTLESEGAQSSDVFLPPDKSMRPEATFHFDSLDMFHSVSTTRDAKNSLNDSGFSFSEQDSDSAASSKLSLTKCPPSPDSTKASLRLPCKITKTNSLSSTLSQSPSMVHSSLPRKVKPTSSIPSSSSSSNSRDPLRQDAKQENPWQRTDNLPQGQPIVSTSRFVRTPASGISSSKVSNNCNSAPRPSKAHGSTSSQRVVDGCEKSASKKSDPPSRMPQLRRGATTLGTVPVIHSSTDYKGNQDVAAATSLKFSSLGKNNKANSQKSSNLPRPGCISPPAPPVRKSSLDQKTKILLPQSALKSAYGEAGRNIGARAGVSEDELEVRHRADSINLKTSSLRADHNNVKVTSSLKSRGTRGEAGHHYGSQMSLERCDSLSLSSPRAGLSRENSGASLGSSSSSSSKVGKSIPRFGIPNSSSSPIATCPSSPGGGTLSKTGQVKTSGNPRALGSLNSSKARSLSANSSKGLSSSTKSLATAVTRNTNANLPPSGRTSAPRTTAAVNSKPGRGTIMGTKQAVRAANSRVSELATGGISGKHVRVSGDSDSGNDSGVNVGEDKPPIAMLPSPYSKITAPRRPQRYSSGHGSDNSSVLSGELPPAMGRTALFYHSGGSSGYESMIRDSEATGSASSAHDSMSESGMSSSGRARSSKYPKKRATGFQRRRLIPAPLPDTSSLGKKVSTAAGQWVDLPPTLKEPFEIKVYEIDDVERLQRGRQEQAAEQPFHDVDKGLLYFNNKLKLLERRQQQVRELKSKHEVLMEELEDTKARLMMDPNKWAGEFDMDPSLDKESPEYLDVLERVIEDLEFCVNLCKSRVMMVTCFDISTQATAAHEEPREVEV